MSRVACYVCIEHKSKCKCHPILFVSSSFAEALAVLPVRKCRASAFGRASGSLGDDPNLLAPSHAGSLSWVP